MVLDKKIAMNYPVRLIHGKKDNEVPWQKSEKIQEQLVSPDAKVIYVADGDHRLSAAGRSGADRQDGGGAEHAAPDEDDGEWIALFPLLMGEGGTHALAWEGEGPVMRDKG